MIGCHPDLTGREDMRDRLFLLSGMLGIGALAMTLILSLIGPQRGPLPAGFITPIMAFEFAESETEVRQIFALPGSAAAMDRVNRWDFLYMALYGSFLCAFALACARQTGRRYYYVAAMLALLTVAADALENVQLLGITGRLNGDDVDGLLTRLHLFTWLKWGGLAVYFLLLWPYFRGQTGLGKIIGPAGQLAASLAVLAYFNRGLLSELFALSVGLMFLLMTVYAWRQILSVRVGNKLTTDLDGYHGLNG
jgi:hypothetical protein